MPNYLMTLSDSLPSHRFRTLDDGPDAVFHRQEFSITKFGMLDTFVISRAFDSSLDPASLRAFSAESMKLSRKHKFFLPCGLFSALVTYPVAVVEQASEELVTFVESYGPKHWSAFEFPVVFETSTDTLYMFSKTPLWGAAYYRGFRKEAQSLLLPGGPLS